MESTALEKTEGFHEGKRDSIQRQTSWPSTERNVEKAEQFKQEKDQHRRDALDRIPLEGKFGQGKNGYRLNYIRARLQNLRGMDQEYFLGDESDDSVEGTV